MGQIGEMVAAAASRALRYGDAMTKGVTPEIAARKPTGYRDGKSFTIDTNHPAFVFGHLSLYPARLWTLRGLDPGPVTPASDWLELFKAGSPCKDDPGATIYPAWPAILARFREGYDIVIKELPKVSNEDFFRENADPRSKEVFPSVGMALTFMFGSHLMVHFGQVSAWRRCFGLPSAM
jgi:hypothetical protein